MVGQSEDRRNFSVTRPESPKQEVEREKDANENVNKSFSVFHLRL